MPDPTESNSAEDNRNLEEPSRAPLSGKVILLLALVALVCTILVSYFTFSSILNRSIQNRLEALKEQGLPSSSVELAQWYSDSLSGENAAPLYSQAFKVMKFTQFGGSVDLYQTPEEPLGKNDLSALESLVKADEEAIALLIEAAEIEDCTFPIDLSLGYEALLPHTARTRLAARLLGYVSLMHAARGDKQKAVDSLIALLKVSRSQQKEPVLISQLVRFACYGFTMQSLHACLHHAEFEDAHLKDLENAFSNGESQDGMRRAFIGERVMGADIFQRVLTGKMKDLQMLGGKALPFIPSAIFKHDFKNYLDDLIDIVEAFDLAEDQRMARFLQIQASVSKLGKHRVISSMILPASISAAKQEFLHKARYRMALLLLAIERFRLLQNRLPEKLEELVPERISELPKDPFSGQAFLFKKEKQGYVIYSVGENQTDDGGAVEGNEKIDEGFWIRRPKGTEQQTK